jgi:hypothetical protein
MKGIKEAVFIGQKDKGRISDRYGYDLRFNRGHLYGFMCESLGFPAHRRTRGKNHQHGKPCRKQCLFHIVVLLQRKIAIFFLINGIMDSELFAIFGN